MEPLRYRTVGGDTGDKYPAWIQALDGKSGVYVIKRKRDGKILYVGESHSHALKKTLIRHFQQWRRDKQNRHAVHDWHRHTGRTYDRDEVLVFALVTRKDQAQKIQYRLIQRLAPLHNDVDGSGEFGDLSDVPF